MPEMMAIAVSTHVMPAVACFLVLAYLIARIQWCLRQPSPHCLPLLCVAFNEERDFLHQFSPVFAVSRMCIVCIDKKRHHHEVALFGHTSKIYRSHLFNGHAGATEQETGSVHPVERRSRRLAFCQFRTDYVPCLQSTLEACLGHSKIAQCLGRNTWPRVPSS